MYVTRQDSPAHMYGRQTSTFYGNANKASIVDINTKLNTFIMTLDLTISFLVRVPVLSVRRYSILPSSSGMVLVRTMVSGMRPSLCMLQLYNTFPISRFTRRLCVCVCVCVCLCVCVCGWVCVVGVGRGDCRTIPLHM